MPRSDVKAKSPPVLLIVLGVAFGVAVLAGVAGIGVGFLLGKGGVAIPAPQSAKVMTREEFQTAVMGKTKDEVLKAVGKPKSTNSTATAQDDVWTYEGYTKDTVTGKVDGLIFVHFDQGRVTHVGF